MKTKALLFTLVFCIATSAFGQQKSTARMRLSFMPPATTQAEVQEDEIYNRGTAALNDGQWQKALDAFQQVAKAGGRRADGALYWRAYTENKMGNRSAATASIAELRKQFPKSTWLKDAGALEVEMRQATGKSTRPESEDDEELKLLAINSLMNTDEARAIPLLQKLLDSNLSAKFKERALFVLSQSDSSQAHAIMDSVARGKTHPELQKLAIRNLGINGSEKNQTTLAEIYKASNDVKVKREVLQSLGVSGDHDQLFALARIEKSPEMNEAVIQALAVAGASQQLRQLYKEYTDIESKDRVLKASIITGDSEFVNEVLKTESNPKLKLEAIHILGINGGEGNNATLVSMYRTEKDKNLKEAALESLFISGDAHSMVELARKETDPEMRKRIVEKLSVMGNREATDYLMEFLDK
jgi:HEAT repeat protein